jgi:UDP-N-acetylglucosamine 2-epimerase (non-hydrolysing)
MAPVIAALEERRAFRQIVVHTGQHYDSRMSDEVLADLDFPDVDIFLGVGSGTHGVQTAKVLSEFEKVLIDVAPEVVVVAGDVNSTLACALAASKLGIAIAHIEAGLRSFDWSMPEEVNRVLTDRLSDLLFTHSPEATDNLEAEGIGRGRVYYVGNTMIDSLRRCEKRAREIAAWETVGMTERGYVLVTLHRPSNVDDPARLAGIVQGLESLAAHSPVVFPIHPRTRARLAEDGGLSRLEDAGVACITFRPNTERPVTLTHGTNVLLGEDPVEIADIRPVSHPPTPCAIPLWDGHSGARVADALVANYAMMPGVVGAHG